MFSIAFQNIQKEIGFAKAFSGDLAYIFLEMYRNYTCNCCSLSSFKAPIGFVKSRNVCGFFKSEMYIIISARVTSHQVSYCEIRVTSHQVSYREIRVTSHQVPYREIRVISHLVSYREIRVKSHQVSYHEIKVASHQVPYREIRATTFTINLMNMEFTCKLDK